jgi:hypothetical protein
VKERESGENLESQKFSVIAVVSETHIKHLLVQSQWFPLVTSSLHPPRQPITVMWSLLQLAAFHVQSSNLLRTVIVSKLRYNLQFTI